MPATLERPTDVETETAAGVCHVIERPGLAVCGAAIDRDEGWCCEDGDPPCGRPPCSTCDRLRAELLS